MFEPSALMRWNSGSTPAISLKPFLAAFSLSPLRTMRGACATGFPSIHGSPATQATSDRHGNWRTLPASGMTNKSGCAGVMLSQVAKPATPAPDFCMPATASAGTSLARCVPKRSVKLNRKNLTLFSWANFARSLAMLAPCDDLICYLFRVDDRFATHVRQHRIGDETLLMRL